MERFDVSGQPLPPTHQLLPSNAVSPSDTRENDVGPHIGDETLIHLAANNLAARPVSEYANSQGHLYPTLRWESPQSPANYLTPGLDRPSKSRSSTRELG